MTATTTATRRVKITRFGCEDVRGAHCVWTINDRLYIGEVLNIVRREYDGAWILECKHMDGSRTPDVAAHYVELLERTYDNGEAV